MLKKTDACDTSSPSVNAGLGIFCRDSAEREHANAVLRSAPKLLQACNL